jgi:hypothetical protein
MTGYYAQQIRMDPPKERLPAWAQEDKDVWELHDLAQPALPFRPT